MQILRELGGRIEKAFKKVKNLNPISSSLLILTGIGLAVCIVLSAPIVLTLAVSTMLVAFFMTTVFDCLTSKPNADNDMRVIEGNIRENNLNLNFTYSTPSLSSAQQATIDLPPAYSSLSPTHLISLDPPPPYSSKLKDKVLKQNSDIQRS